MIYSKDAPDLACLRHPDLLAEMTRPDFESALNALERAEFADPYKLLKAADHDGVPLSRTLLSDQVRILREGLAEWPSRLADLLSLMLRTKTGIPSAGSLDRWETIRHEGAYRRLTPLLMRMVSAAVDGHVGEWVRPEEFAVWQQIHNPELVVWAANSDVWSAGKALFTSALWMLSYDTEPKVRRFLASLSEGKAAVKYTHASTLYWALSRPSDDQALMILRQLAKTSLTARHLRMVLQHIQRIDERRIEPPASERDSDRDARRKLEALASSGYEIVTNEARSLLSLGDSPGISEIVKLLNAADGSKPSRRWEAVRDELLKRHKSPKLREALMGVVAAYNAITAVRPILSVQEFEAHNHFRKTGTEQPGNPAARGIAERERERARVYGTNIPGIESLSQTAVTFARGALWTLAAMEDADLVDFWAQTVSAWSRMGDPNPTIAYAAMYALSNADPDLALVRLQELRLRVRHKNLVKRIAAAFDTVAKARGLSIEDLADELVPDHALSPAGERTWAVGAWIVQLRLEDGCSVALSYVDPKRKSRKSLPKEVAGNDPDAIKAARMERKAIAATMTLQKGRLEAAMISGRRWPAASWTKTFGRHPILSRLARRLIWRIEGLDGSTKLAMPATAAWRGPDREAFEIADDDRLSLPHPVDLNDQTLTKWRSHLIESRTVQPFKQIFRETYKPADGERELLECGRFANLVVPLSTVRALLAPRGWTGGFGLAGFDGSGQGERVFAPFGVRAFMSHGEDKNLHFGNLETIQFYRQDGRERVPLAEVPLVVFSETLRDVDLVASAAISMVAEAGPLGSAQSAFASAIGLARAPLVRQLIDGLGFGDRVAFEGSYAIVDGKFRIHLGSGVIERAGKNDVVRLPFDLSTLRGISLPFDSSDDPIARIVANIMTLSKRGSETT